MKLTEDEERRLDKLEKFRPRLTEFIFKAKPLQLAILESLLDQAAEDDWAEDWECILADTLVKWNSKERKKVLRDIWMEKTQSRLIVDMLTRFLTEHKDELV